jgi:hypothetical protein
MIDLLIDHVVPSVSALPELVSTSWVETRETRHAHLTVAAVALVDKPLLPYNPNVRKDDQHILVPVFPLPWTSCCLSWVIPSGIQSRPHRMIDHFFIYRRNSSDEIMQPTYSLWSFELASRHPLVLPVQTLGFLLSDSKTTGSCTIIHTKPQRVPSQC